MDDKDPIDAHWASCELLRSDSAAAWHVALRPSTSDEADWAATSEVEAVRTVRASAERASMVGRVSGGVLVVGEVLAAVERCRGGREEEREAVPFAEVASPSQPLAPPLGLGRPAQTATSDHLSSSRRQLSLVRHEDRVLRMHGPPSQLPPVELPRAHAHPVPLPPPRHELELADRHLAPFLVHLVVALVRQRVRRRCPDRVEQDRHRDGRRRQRLDPRLADERARFLRARSTSRRASA